jgi:hypothetical protein
MSQLEFNYSGFDELLDDMPSPLELSSVGGCEISTVKLPQIAYPDGVWETCAFYADDTSQMLEQYTNEENARAGHRRHVDFLISKSLLNPESNQ